MCRFSASKLSSWSSPSYWTSFTSSPWGVSFGFLKHLEASAKSKNAESVGPWLVTYGVLCMARRDSTLPVSQTEFRLLNRVAEEANLRAQMLARQCILLKVSHDRRRVGGAEAEPLEIWHTPTNTPMLSKDLSLGIDFSDPKSFYPYIGCIMITPSCYHSCPER